MKRNLALLTAALATAAAGLAITGTAHATETTPASAPVWGTCPNLHDWDVHEDETTRMPTAGVDGVTFTGDQLIHHPVNASLINLTHGTYEANPAPDQSSFFSIEVADPTTNGYATLRWDTEQKAWTMFSGTFTATHAKASDFIGEQTKYGKLTDKTRATFFGVGYTQNPPGTVTTVVSSVTFRGVTYPLTCAPVATPTTKPVTTAPTTRPTTPPTTAPTIEPTALPPGAGNGGGTLTGGGALPITGPSVWALVPAGLAALGLGVVLLVWRRRKVRFQA